MSNWINVVFVIDKSGSMVSSTNDVIEGWQKVISEQKSIKDGRATVSLFTFNHKVEEIYLGKDVNEVGEFNDYIPNGMTALYDGVGQAVTKVGKWLHDKDVKGEEMPSKTLVAIITDGFENSSVEYNKEQIQEMIKEQTEKYSWEFVYIGADLTTAKDATSLGVKTKAFTTKKGLGDTYAKFLNSATSVYRKATSLFDAKKAIDETLCSTALIMNDEYEKTTGVKIDLGNNS